MRFKTNLDTVPQIRSKKRMLLCDLHDSFKSSIDGLYIFKTVIFNVKTAIRLFINHTKLKISCANL